jgi:hypothetical protein
MTPSRSSSFGSAPQIAALASFLLFGAACSGGGGSSPTEPAPPAPEVLVLHIDWEYEVDEDEGLVTGTSYPIAGNEIVLLNRDGQPGTTCTKDGVWAPCLFFYGDDGEIVEVVWNPENVRFIAECRTTSDGEVQAFYHDPYSHSGPGTLGPLVTSGCSFAEEYDHWVKCCVMDP